MTTTAAEIAHHAGGTVVAGTPDAVVDVVGVRLARARTGRVLRRAARRPRRPRLRRRPRSRRARRSRSSRTSLPGVRRPPAGARSCRSTTCSRACRSSRAPRRGRASELSRRRPSPARPARRRRRISSPRRSRRSAATRARRRTTTSSACRSRCSTRPPTRSVVVAEMGERFPGDIAALCAIARPDIGVVTNVGLAHAEHLGGAPGAARRWASCSTSLPAGGLAVLNADDEWTPHARGRPTASTVVTVGTAAGADYRIADVELDDQLHPSFSLDGHRFTVPLHGEHQARERGARARGRAPRLRHRPRDRRPTRWPRRARPAGGSSCTSTTGGVTVLNDAYNANPTSMDAALRALGRTADARPPDRGARRHARARRAQRRRARRRSAGTRPSSRVDVLIGVGAGGRGDRRAAARGAGARGARRGRRGEARCAIAPELVDAGRHRAA